ncbi:WxL domain-containing protein [Enterococcus sp. OL5]|uniref:WxL domain-containing protein n=1 Tax=Enterococcus sp. OL5 TaxID=2590214 RepID=UPI001128C024|nr:WxL domain-containing protein [Enterococcus sp. OL5]TPR56917.1 WxL domain-containing protein [Enterococcus sp. OL5]
MTTRFRRPMLVLGATILIMQAIFMPVGMVYAETTMDTEEQEQVELPPMKNYLEDEQISDPRFFFTRSRMQGTAEEPLQVTFFSDQEVSEARVFLPEEATLLKEKLPTGISVEEGAQPNEWMVQSEHAQTTFVLPIVVEKAGKYELSVEKTTAHLEISEQEEINEELANVEQEELKEENEETSNMDLTKNTEVTIDNATDFAASWNDPNVSKITVNTRAINLVGVRLNQRTTPVHILYAVPRGNSVAPHYWVEALRTTSHLTLEGPAEGYADIENWAGIRTNRLIESYGGDVTILNGIRLIGVQSSNEDAPVIEVNNATLTMDGNDLVSPYITEVVASSQISSVTPIVSLKNSANLIINKGGIAHTIESSIPIIGTSEDSNVFIQGKRVMIGGNVIGPNQFVDGKPSYADPSSQRHSWNRVDAHLSGENASIVQSETSAPNNFGTLYSELYNSGNYHSLVVDVPFNSLGFSLDVEASLDTEGSPAASGIYFFEGEQASIEANPATGYSFVRWEIISGTGSSIGNITDEKTTLVMGSSDTEVLAIYEEQSLDIETTNIDVLLGTESEHFDINSFVKSVIKVPGESLIDDYTVELDGELDFNSIGKKEISLKIIVGNLTSNILASYNVVWGNTLGSLDYNSTQVGLSFSLLSENNTPVIRAGLGEVLNNINDTRTFNRIRTQLLRGNVDNVMLDLQTNTVHQSKVSLTNMWNEQLKSADVLQYGDVLMAQVFARDTPDLNITSDNMVASRNEEIISETGDYDAIYYMITSTGYHLLRVNELTTNKISIPFKATAEEMNKLITTFFSYGTDFTEEEKKQLKFEWVNYDDTSLTGDNKSGTISVTQIIDGQGEFTVDYEVSFEVEAPTIVNPVDPLDPEVEIDPEKKPELPDDQGQLSIDFISSFNFGSQAISVHDQVYYAQPQRLLNEDGTVNEDEERPNYVQISDRRPESDRNGWQLALTQAEQFEGQEGHQLTGASLSLLNQQLATTQGGEFPTLQATTSVTLVPGNKRTLIRAEGKEGTGTWIYRFGDGETAGESVALNVPKRTNPEATTYSTTLIWELSAVPGN